MKKLGIYIHIPFCLKKCLYCDFYSEPGTDETVWEQYVAALLKEIEFYGRHLDRDYCADTLFIGGGTPSLLKPELIREILGQIRESFPVSEDAEITIECNPATLTADKLAMYRDAGINRLSIGAQSFSPELLTTLGRVHSAGDIIRTVELARVLGFDNINLDVMFGIPGQTLAQWEDTVEKLFCLAPEHISFYSMELSQGTPFYEMYRSGRLEVTSEELDREMYHYLLGKMTGAGYAQYEISNGARPGFECRHNLKYWNLDEYLGLGASAHSYIQGYRFFNTADVREYIKAMSEPEDSEKQAAAGADGSSVKRCGDAEHEFEVSGAAEQLTQNSLRDDITDLTFTALRKTEGIDTGDFESRFGCGFWEYFAGQREEFMEFVGEGYAVDDGKAVRITRKGFDIANRIITLFI